eukprot:TRINITY_DN282_c4_g1_i1.p1 TRINITY_DN282_c4_g1~~TRINITY_DN282_c4_g1_i1.p1  ORF type:complete len:258 (+),score=64.60 TRINITY_DN282_c4_g1_i1:84-776(+)
MVVLATDLDGTFVGGDPSDKKELYELIEANRHKITLIYVTGRSMQSIRRLEHIPKADYYISDVGTMVWKGTELFKEVQEKIDARWSEDHEKRAKEMMDGVPGVGLQPSAGGRRVAFDYIEHELETSVWDLGKMFQEAGFNPIISHRKYLDVLPHGVSKGPTLKSLLEHITADTSKLITAGDTLNDLSMFHYSTSLASATSILVGNADKEVREALKEVPNIHRAERAGAGT